MSSSKKNTALGVTSTQSGHTGVKDLVPSVADFMPGCQGQSLEKSMSEIEKMKRYIERTNMNIENPLQYAMNMREAFELAHMAGAGDALSIKAISMAFNYGQAKGYRAAKAEGRARA